MKRKLLIALSLALVASVVAVVGIAAAEGDSAVRPRLRHGIILEIQGDSLTLRTRRGQITVQTDEDTRFRVPGVSDPGLDDLSDGDHIGVAGRLTEDDTLLARLILLIPRREQVGQLRGELTAKGEDWLEITRPDGGAVTVLVSERTRFRIPGVEDPGLDDLQIGDPVFARGLWNGAGELKALLIVRVPDSIQDALRGKVTEVDPPNLSVLTRRGPALVITDDNTRFRVPGVEEASLADISVDDFILAAGTWEEGELHAVITAVVPERPQRAVRHGVVIGNDGSTLTLETPCGPVTVLTDEHTRFRVAGVENPTIEDVEVGFQALAAGRWLPEQGALRARLVGARPRPSTADLGTSR